MRLNFFSMARKVDEVKQAIVFVSVIAIITVIDSQFINFFYRTSLGIPSDLNESLFVAFVILTIIISTMLLWLGRSTNISTRILKITYAGTVVVQYLILGTLIVTILEMQELNEYHKELSLLVVYLSHIWACAILCLLTIRFMQWFNLVRSPPLLVSGAIFIVVIFLILATIPLFTDQIRNQPSLIYPRQYLTLVLGILTPSGDVAFVYGLGTYFLPLLLASTWILTVSLLISYARRIGRAKFWLMMCLPLFYQVIVFLLRDSNLVNDPNLIRMVHSPLFLVVFGISYQVSGLFFAAAFILIARKIRGRSIKHSLILSSIGIFGLFASIQPGLPFYAAYPPFGLVTATYLALSSFLLLVGILDCAAYASKDNELRRQIYKDFAGSDMFNKMGLAEAQLEMEKAIFPLADKIKAEELTFRHNIDLSDEDIRATIDEVLREVHSMRLKRDSEL